MEAPEVEAARSPAVELAEERLEEELEAAQSVAAPVVEAAAAAQLAEELALEEVAAVEVQSIRSRTTHPLQAPRTAGP